MTDARVEMVSADAATARVFLDRAEGFLSDAAGGGMTASGRQILLWQACMSAMEAVLLAAGRRVTGGDGSHVLRLEETQRRMGTEHLDLFERLDTHRELRHEASYPLGVVSENETETTRQDAERLLEAARHFVEEGL